MIFRITPKILPLCALVIIPQMIFVGVMIAKIKQTIQLRPKYLFVLAINSFSFFYIQISIYANLLYKTCRNLSTLLFILYKFVVYKSIYDKYWCFITHTQNYSCFSFFLMFLIKLFKTTTACTGAPTKNISHRLYLTN